MTSCVRLSKPRKVNSEFIKVANANGIQYVDDAMRLADLSAVKVGEDGKVEGVEEIVKALVENKPYLVAQKKAKAIGEASNQVSDRSDKTADQLLAEAAEKARKTNKPEDKIAFAKLKRELGK